MNDRDSQTYCMTQTRMFDPDRYLAALFARATQRPGLFALYAFNLELSRIRETVSEPLLGRMRLQWWRDAITSLFDDSPPRHQVLTALAAAVARHDLQRAQFEKLIDGREQDFEDQAPDDLAALERYARETAVPLFAMALSICGAGDDDATALAHHAGLAWGLGGVLRAVAVSPRPILPETLLCVEGAAPESVRRRESSAGLCRAVRVVAAAAAGHLAAARPLSRDLPEAIPALAPLAATGQFLRRLSRRRFDPFAAGLEPAHSLRQARIAWAGWRRRI